MCSAGLIANWFNSIGVPEVALFGVLLLLVLGVRWLLTGEGRRGNDESDPAGRPPRDGQEPSPKDEEATPPRLSIKDHLVLWLAEGFGSGLAPVAPGTFGSVVGLVWFILLVRSGDFTLYVIGMLLGIAVAVPLCGAAERILKQHDPSSVVLDEIVAVPICFLPWVFISWQRLEAMPTVSQFYTDGAWQISVGLFILFRAFDALKPWPISKIQDLPGGWGVTADDVLAAIAVALLSLFVVR